AEWRQNIIIKKKRMILFLRSPFRLRDFIANIFLSLRAPAGSAAISLLSSRYEIASVASLPRNDVATESRRLESNDVLIPDCVLHDSTRMRFLMITVILFMIR